MSPQEKVVENKKTIKKNTATNNRTYSEATKVTVPNTNQDLHTYKDTTAKILTCILHSHLNNIAHSGTYQNVLNGILKCNNLPEIIIPDESPSKRIIQLAMNKDVEEKDEDRMEEEEEYVEESATIETVGQ